MTRHRYGVGAAACAVDDVDVVVDEDVGVEEVGDGLVEGLVEVVLVVGLGDVGELDVPDVVALDDGEWDGGAVP